MTTSIIIMEDTSTNLNVTGTETRADGYFGYTDGKHTISVKYSNFTGRFYLEGTLASTPSDDDWFVIQLTPVNSYIEKSEFTGIEGYTFVGNFTYIRVRMDRSYITPTPTTDDEIATLGAISRVLLNH